MRARARTRTEKPSAPPKAKLGPRRPPQAAPPRAKAEKPEVRIFVSYSHRDADTRTRLETHLAPLKREGVLTWFDGDLNAGDRLDTEIARELRKPHVFVGLLSPDYLASNYCWKIEYKRAMGRRARGTMRVVAVVVRHCDWKSTPAAGFKLVPEDGKEVTRWRNADDAFLNVAQGIRRVVAAVRKDMAATASQTAAKKRLAPKAGPKPAAKRASTPKPRTGGAGARTTGAATRACRGRRFDRCPLRRRTRGPSSDWNGRKAERPALRALVIRRDVVWPEAVSPHLDSQR